MKCYRCKTAIDNGLPRAGLTRMWGKVTRTSWRIRFNYLRMNSWENAKTASEVVASSTYADVELCDACWGDVLNFITTTRTRP